MHSINYMEPPCTSAIALPDLLRALSADALELVFGGTFSTKLTGCRLACRDLRDLHDREVTELVVQLSAGAAEDWAQAPPRSCPPLGRFPRCTSLRILQAPTIIRRSYSTSELLPGLQLLGMDAVLPAAARQRITRLQLGQATLDNYYRPMSRLRCAVTSLLGSGQFPALEDLDLLVTPLPAYPMGDADEEDEEEDEGGDPGSADFTAALQLLAAAVPRLRRSPCASTASATCSQDWRRWLLALSCRSCKYTIPSATASSSPRRAWTSW